MIVSLTSSAQQPEARWTHGMCFDRANQAVLMFGGNGPDRYFGDLWSFSKGSWKKLSDGGPSPRNKFAFAYDQKRKRAVLFGGAGPNEELLSDAWEWDGESWKQIDIPGPAKRVHPLAAYDPQSETVIVRGGFGTSGLLTDTWSYDGTKWIELVEAGDAGGGFPHGLFADESAKRLTLINVETNDQSQPFLRNTWWTLIDNKWELDGKEFPSTSKQSIQAISAFGKGGILIFDGDNVKNNRPTTSWFSNGTWTSKNLDGPEPRIGHVMVWDPARSAVVLFGGYNRKTFFNDLWIWQKEKWTQLK